MKIRLLVFLIVLIPAAIAVLLFGVANALFEMPGVLFGTIQPTYAILCVIAGALLLVPAILVIVTTLINWISDKRNTNNKG